MTCGSHLRDRRQPADPAAAMALFGLGRRPQDVYASLWADKADAEESVRLNRGEHGHGDAVYGPALTERGWVTLVDLLPAIARAIRDRDA